MGEYSFSFISFELGLFSFCTFSCFFGEYQRMPLEKQQKAEVFLDVAFGSRVKEGAMNYRTSNTPIQIQRTDLGAQISWFCFWQVANITLRVFQSERKPWSKENALHNVGSDFPSEAFFLVEVVRFVSKRIKITAGNQVDYQTWLAEYILTDELNACACQMVGDK